MRKNYVLKMSFAAALCIIPQILSADAFVTLESITLMEEELSGIGEAKIISQERLEKNQAKEMKEVFKDEPSISVGGGGRNAQRVYLRGIEGTNLNITIDGAKQGGSLYQHMGDVGSIDPSLLKSVEVSTIAGADKGNGALGGSIAFETVDAQDLLRKDQDLGAAIRGGYYSASDGYGGGASVYGRINDKSGLLIDVSGVHQDDYRTGDGGDAYNTSVKDRNYFVKYSLLDYNDQSLKLGATHTTNEGYYVSGSAGSDMGAPKANQATNRMITTRDTYTFDHRYNPKSDWIDLRTNLYYNDRNLENKTSVMDVTSKNYGGNIKNTLSLSGDELNHLFTFGADYDVEDGITKANNVNGSKITNTSNTVGAFVQGSSTYRVVTLKYGVRLDDYSIEYGPKREITGHEFSPNVGAEVEIYDGLSAFTNYSESIKIGSIVPVQWLSNVTTATTFNGLLNGTLEPETSKQIEGGVRYKAKSFLSENDRVSAGISLFKTTLSHLIQKTGSQWRINDLYNLDSDVLSKGYELKATYVLAPFKTSIGLIHADVEDEDGNAILNTRRLASSIGDTMVWDSSWEITPYVQLGYTLTAVNGFDDVSSGTLPRAGYAIHDVSLRYKPASIQNLTLNFGINNIFDKEYYAQSSIEGSDDTLVEEVGREFRASFRYVF